MTNKSKQTDLVCEITINGQRHMVAQATTLGDLVELLELPNLGVAIALNSEIIPKSNWKNTILTTGICVEVVSIASGG